MKYSINLNTINTINNKLKGLEFLVQFWIHFWKSEGNIRIFNLEENISSIHPWLARLKAYIHNLLTWLKALDASYQIHMIFLDLAEVFSKNYFFCYLYTGKIGFSLSVKQGQVIIWYIWQIVLESCYLFFRQIYQISVLKKWC